MFINAINQPVKETTEMDGQSQKKSGEKPKPLTIEESAELLGGEVVGPVEMPVCPIFWGPWAANLHVKRRQARGELPPQQSASPETEEG